MNQGLVWNLVFAQLVNIYPVFCRIRKFIAELTTAHRCVIYYATQMQSTHLHYYTPATPNFSKYNPSRFLFIHLLVLSSRAAVRHAVSLVAKKCGFRSFELLYCFHLQSRNCVTVTPIYIYIYIYRLLALYTGRYTGSQDRSFGTVTGRRYGRLKNSGSVSGRGIKQSSVLQRVQMGSGTQEASYFGSEDAGVKLTSRLHLVPRLGMSGSILPFPIRFHSFHKDKYNMHTY